MINKFISSFLITALIISPAVNYAQESLESSLPRPGAMVSLTPAYVPVLIKGIKIHQDNPLAMDFIVDTGNSGLDLKDTGSRQILSDESEKLIKYFLAGLALPEKEVWVNLSPYEKDRIIPAGLGQTGMGRDMLAEDYILKQLTASLTYPEKGLGRDFWDRVYKEAYQKFGTTRVPVNTFNKVWIVADKAGVYENNDTAFVINAHLKVMLEEDYLSMQKHQGRPRNVLMPKVAAPRVLDLSQNIIRQIIIPALEKEVNEGRNFANLRQIFHSLILAKWYKQALKQALLNQVYSNKSKLAGVSIDDRTVIQRIYARYLQAYKKGVFNFIKEDVDQATRQPLPRKYFSGGVVGNMDLSVTRNPQDAAQLAVAQGRYVLVAEVMGKALGHDENNDNARMVSLRDYLQDRGFDTEDDPDLLNSNPTVGVSPADQKLLNVYTGLARKQQADAAMLDQGPKRLRGGFDENVYTVLSGTNATVVLYEEERRTSKPDHVLQVLLDKKVIEARQYLSTKHMGDLHSGPIQIKRLSREIKYGYAIDHDTKTIYISPSFDLKLQIQNPSENFDFLVRKSIFLLLFNPQLGQKYEYEYAFDHYRDRVIALFPDQSEPNQLVAGIEKGILLNGIDLRNPEDAYLNLAERILGTMPEQLNFIHNNNKNEVYGTVRSGKTAVIEAGESVRLANEEVLKRAREAMFIMGINALDGITDYRQGAAQSTAQFSSKFNPITIAHTFITILYTYAISGTASYGVNVSEFDPRKKDIQKSYSARLGLARSEIISFFRKLVGILPSREEIRTWNGEEVAIIQASHEPLPQDRTKKYTYLYTAGGDHYYVWGPFDPVKNELPDLVRFDEINKATLKYYSFYAGIGEGAKYGLKWKEYQRLVKQQIDHGDRLFYDATLVLNDKQRRNKTLDMIERERVITAILNAKSQQDMEAVFNKAKILPYLDTAGKMVLARKALARIEFVLAHTIRKGENFGDKLRGFFITHNELKVFNVDGLNAGVAASNTREGLIAYLFGIFNFNLLYGASIPTLKTVFNPQDRAPLETLLRQTPLILPKSISNMLRDKESAHKRLFGALQKDILSMIRGSKVEEATASFTLDDQERVTDKGKSIVMIKIGDQLPLQIDYQIENTINAEGNPVNRLHYSVLQNTIGFNSANAEMRILDYIREFNDVPKDAAMYSPVKVPAMISAAVNPGGIDLNTGQMSFYIQKQGSGAGINFDPALIAKFDNSDFQGFIPIIIDIRAINNMAPMLGTGKYSFPIKGRIFSST